MHEQERAPDCVQCQRLHASQALLGQGQPIRARLVAQQLLEQDPESPQLLAAAAEATAASNPDRALEAVTLARHAAALNAGSAAPLLQNCSAKRTAASPRALGLQG